MTLQERMIAAYLRQVNLPPEEKIKLKLFLVLLDETYQEEPQSRAEQSRAEQSRAEQSRAEQSRAEQSRAEQSRAEQSTRAGNAGNYL